MPSVDGSDTGSATAVATSTVNKSSGTKKGQYRSSKKTRRVKKKDATPMLPSQVVCTPQALAASKNSVELGLLISIAIVGLYLYGFWESVQALPDIETGLLLPGHTMSEIRLKALKNPLRQPAISNQNGNGINQQNVVPNSAEIPEAVWPVTYKQEIENKELEAMIHPGDKKTTMWIPKMWSYPVHHNQQFTREQAMKIGSCIEPDPVTGSYARGTNCPPDKRTIFIAIASYRDFQCRYTVESAFNRAKHPERIRFGTFYILCFA